MRMYFQRLKAHPGLPMVALLTPVFLLAGMSGEGQPAIDGLIVGGVASLPFWAIVLWTARTQPLPQETGHDNQ